MLFVVFLDLMFLWNNENHVKRHLATQIILPLIEDLKTASQPVTGPKRISVLQLRR